MHLRVQEVSNFLAVGGLGSPVSRIDPLPRIELHLTAEASISRFVLLHGVAAVSKPPIPRASAGPENDLQRSSQQA
jgi:hypothetical protein